MSNEMFKPLESIISSLMADSQVPGLSIAIAKGDELIYAKGFGARDLEHNIPATPDTIYGFGSCSKSYTALAIMQLVGEGKIKLDDPVSKYLPVFRTSTSENQITIHHLLTQTSGIPMLGYGHILFPQYENMKKSSWVPMSNWDDFFRFIDEGSQEFLNKPGEIFFYANENFALLGQIVEKISQMKYEDYVKEKILKPLKMTCSMFSREDFEKFTDVFTPYAIRMKNGTPLVTETIHPFDLMINAAGGILSTIKDQINYLIAMMNGGQFQENKVLDSSLLEKMHTSYIDNKMIKETVGGFEQEGYGYGWMVLNDYFGHKLVMHGGQINGATTFIAFLPDAKIAVAVACNSHDGQMATAMTSMITIASLLGKNPMEEFKFLEYEGKLEMLTGKYASYKGIFRGTVTKMGSQLYFEREDILNLSMEKIPLFPESDTLETLRFYYMSGPMAKAHAEFKIHSPGNVDLLINDTNFHRRKDA